MSAPIFISFASKDHALAETICAALENRGYGCWISTRDIDPGDNFQSAIVHAIRSAKVMVLVFSSNSNNSDEIKKELVLAGQSRLIVIPVRVEDVTPDDAFAYEFATRQWIDAFDDWEQSVGRLVGQLRRVGGIEPTLPAAPDGGEASPRGAPGPDPHEERREPHSLPAAGKPPASPAAQAADAASPTPAQPPPRRPIVVLSLVGGGIAVLLVALTLVLVGVFQKPAAPPAAAPQAQTVPKPAPPVPAPQPQVPKPPPAAPAPAAGHPLIMSVTPLLPRGDQKIVITGSGFGHLVPYVGNSAFIQLSDATGWSAGSTRDPGGDLVTLAISAWTDTAITVDGLQGQYGKNNWSLNPGDRVQMRVWNAQTNAGPATFTAAVLPANAIMKNLQLTRSAVSGSDTGIAYAGRWDANCQALPSSVLIVTPPANGVVAVVRAQQTLPASTPGSGDTGPCAGKTVPSNLIMYRSNPDFHGTNSVAYFSLGGTTVISTNVTINVP